MTVENMYKLTKAWMFENPSSTIYDNYIVPITNKVLAELFEENNNLRMFKGMAPFQDGVSSHLIPADADLTTAMNFELDYEDEYQYDVIPKGIDANFLMDDDLSKMAIYQTEYNNARVAHQVLVPASTIAEYQ